MANGFLVPEYIISGEGALKESVDSFKSFGKRALIVTDGVMVTMGNVEKVAEVLKGADVDYVVYQGVVSEPDDTMVEQGAKIYKEKQCDFLIGLGGGSPIDTAKAIGVVVANGGNICEYAERKIAEKLPAVAAIPTTAGTGSEATCVSVIKDTSRHIKMMLSDRKLMASLAVVDPVFTMTAPRSVTISTGLDALCHAIESFSSRKAFYMSRIYSIDAVKKIYNNLPVLSVDGNDKAARKAMSEAALEAGIAFSNSSVSLIHGMSRPVGAMFHIPHGVSNALLLKVCLPYMKEGAERDFYLLARELGLYKGEDIAEGADMFLEKITEMLKELKISNINDMGIDKKEFFKVIPKMAADALVSGSPGNCKNIPGKEQICELYARLWE